MLEVSPVPQIQPRKSTHRDPWTEDEARAVLSAASRSGVNNARKVIHPTFQN